MYKIGEFKLKYNFLIALFILGLLSLMVQCKTTELPSKNKDLQSNALLWQISSQHISHVSYLFGTIHMIPADRFFLPEGTIQAIEETSLVFFEVDLNQMNDVSEQLDLLQKSFMKDDVTLKDLLPSEDYKLVRSHFADMGIPVFMLERIKPMFLTVFSDESLSPGAMNNGSHKFYEFEFMAIAKENDKKIKGLEKIEYQMGLMDSIPYEIQAEMLVESIKASEGASEEMDSLINLYCKQDIEALYESFANDELSVYDSLLLINRNHNWIPEMESAMSEAACFFAVGAAHLGGPDGVIRLLEQKGYTLKPVQSNRRVDD